MGRFSLFRRKEEAADANLPQGGGSLSSGKKPGKRTAASPDGEDPLLPEKKRARRRLVGAITITLAAIIVLPMVFDTEPQTVSQELLVDIPSREKSTQAAAKEAAKKKAEEKTAVEPVPDKKETAAQPAASASKATAQADSAREKPAAVDSKAEAKTAAKPDAKTETKTATAQKTEDPIGQLIAKNANASASEKGKPGKFVIQVAAVSTPEKAKELQAKLQKAGLTSYTQKVALKDGGERIRIRVGPLDTQKEVSSACAKLSQLKLPCTLIK